MQMRSWLADVIEPGLHKLKPGLRFATVDLFECVIRLLEERGLLTKAFDMQLKQGDEAVLKSLRSVLKEDRLAARIASFPPHAVAAAKASVLRAEHGVVADLQAEAAAFQGTLSGPGTREAMERFLDRKSVV